MPHPPKTPAAAFLAERQGRADFMVRAANDLRRSGKPRQELERLRDYRGNKNIRGYAKIMAADETAPDAVVAFAERVIKVLDGVETGVTESIADLDAGVVRDEAIKPVTAALGEAASIIRRYVPELTAFAAVTPGHTL